MVKSRYLILDMNENGGFGNDEYDVVVLYSNNVFDNASMTFSLASMARKLFVIIDVQQNILFFSRQNLFNFEGCLTFEQNTNEVWI